MKNVNAVVVVIGLLAVSGISSATLIHHWKMDDTLAWNGSAWGDVVDSVAGNPAGALWGYVATDSVNTNVTNQPGVPLYTGDMAYNFTEPTGISGVITNNNTALPTTGDFTLKVQMKTTNLHTTQGHLFSNNNGQTGRANLYVENGSLKWFHNGGVSLVDATADKGSIFDGNWHEVGIAREGGRFDLLRDGQIVASATATGAAAFSTNTAWMIARMRSFSGDFDGSIADVKVYDTYIPEPATLLLLGLGVFTLRGSKKV